MKRILFPFLASMALLGLTACGGGGGGSSPTTGTLTYTNPAYQGLPYQFALVRDAASTSSTLVLDVVGPTGTGYALPSVGVTFGFSVDLSKASWGTAPVVANGTVFPAGTGVQLVKGWVTGGYLQGIVATKGLTSEVADVGNGVIAKITLTAVPGAATGAVALSDTLQGNFMDNSGPPALPVKFAVGTLTLN